MDGKIYETMRKALEATGMKFHPIYDCYYCDPLTGNVFSIFTSKKLNDGKTNQYLSVSVRGRTTKQKTLQAHRFVWECVHGTINEDNVEIDHIDEIKSNNKIDNLQLLTHKKNLEKSVKKRDYSFVKNNHANRRAIKATCEDGNVTHYESIAKASKATGINVGLISYSVRKLNNCKGGTSKTDGKYYTFEYSDQELEISKRVRNGNKKILTDEDRRERSKLYMKKYLSKPEVKEKVKQQKKEYIKKPESKERFKEYQKKYLSSEEAKEKHREAMRKYMKKRYLLEKQKKLQASLDISSK